VTSSAQGVKGFILGSFRRRTSLCTMFAAFTETFGEVCELQKLSFFSIGHSLTALAFVVFGPEKLADGVLLRLKTEREPPSDYSVCIA
jgi:hypothetical protein